MNLPTKITLSRIITMVVVLIGLFVLDCIPGFKPLMIPYTGYDWSTKTWVPVINLVYLIVFVIFILASSTDAVDGHIARSRNLVTDLGKFLDPVADKILVNSMLIFLCIPHYGLDTMTIHIACVILMILRDLIVDALRFIAAQKGIVIAANIFGKLKTIFQMIAIPVILVNGFPFSYFDMGWPRWLRISQWFVYAATFLSVLSGIIYVYRGRHVLFGDKKQDAESK